MLEVGGRLVVADPDQESLVDLAGAGRELIDRVKALRRDVGYRNRRFVSSMPGRMAALGFTDVQIEAFPLV